jgi:hypothetical protein
MGYKTVCTYHWWFLTEVTTIYGCGIPSSKGTQFSDSTSKCSVFLYSLVYHNVWSEFMVSRLRSCHKLSLRIKLYVVTSTVVMTAFIFLRNSGYSCSQSWFLYSNCNSPIELIISGNSCTVRHDIMKCPSHLYPLHCCPVTPSCFLLLMV